LKNLPLFKKGDLKGEEGAFLPIGEPFLLKPVIIKLVN
jgi:hypothetical protein